METEDIELQKKLLNEYRATQVEKAREEDPTYKTPEESEAEAQAEGVAVYEKLNEAAERKKPNQEPKKNIVDKVKETGSDFVEWHRNRPLNANPANWAYMTGMGALDVPFDIIGAIPGLGGIDETWDHNTRFNNPGAAKFREIASVIVPTVATTGAYGKYLAGTKLTGLTKAVANVGGVGLINGAIAGISDFGEDPNNRLLTHPDNFARLAKAYPEYFGPDGFFPDVGALADADATDPRFNRLLAGIDETVLSGLGDLIGYGLNYGKPLLRGILPTSKKSKAWKSNVLIQNVERDTKNRVVDLDMAINSGTLKPNQVKALEEERALLINQAVTTGASKATQNPGESFIKNRQRQKDAVRDQRALRKLSQNTTNFDPDITPSLASDKNLTNVSYTPPGAAVQNVVDVDAQIAGAIDPLSVPTKPYTTAMEEAMIIGPNTRKVLSEVTESALEADNYKAVQGAFRTNNKVAGERVFEVYNRIMKAGTGDALREILSDPNVRDSKKLFNEFGEKIKKTYLDEATAEASAVAIFDLINLYVGREITESSARVMHTLGAEISAKAGAPVQFKNLLDDQQVFKNLQDKLEVLEVEYGISKFVAGWQLNNRKWWKHWIDEVEDTGEIAIKTLQEFGEKQKIVRNNYKAFRKELDAAAAKDPKLARTLMKAYDTSNGNVDTLIKLQKFAKYHLNPGGLIYNKAVPELGISGMQMNQFSKGAWAVTYNNVLSGLSSLRAAVGNGSMLILKPISAFSRASVTSVLKRDLEPLERVSYMYGDMFETAGRALDDAVKRMKKVHQDPDFMMQAARKDFVLEDSNTWEVLDDYAENWLKDGDHINNFMYGWANWQRKIARQPWLRTGVTGMSSIDAYTDTFMGTFQSRLAAYDEVFTKYGKSLDPEVFTQKLKNAEELNYSKMFDKQGLLKEGAAKRASGEIALNLDDGFSKAINPWLNKMPVLKSLMMFPRTSMNQLKLAMSYTPVSLIPGIGKYGDVLMAARTNDMELIKKTLLDHGVKNFDETPEAMAIFRNLKDEYEGRLMMGAGTTALAYMYAMSGGVRGNGPVNHNELIKLKKRGWKPNTVKIGNSWVSYKGIPMVEQFLNLMGDMAFYQTALGSNMTEELHSKVMWTIAATYLNQSPLQGIEPIAAMVRGDEGAFKRLAAQNVRAASFQSGLHGVIAKGITNAQKEIYNDFLGYVRNNTVFKDMSYSKIDHWTGEEIDEIDNPILRALNAVNPVKVHGGNEPWRLWLLNSGFDDIAEIKKSSKGITYTPEERELIGKFMGQQQLWKRLNSKEFMHNKVFNRDLDKLRQYINSGADEAEVAEFRNKLDVYEKLKKMINQAKEKAERQIANDDRYKHIDILGLSKQKVKNLMDANDIDGAAAQSRKNYAKKQEFLKYGVKN